MSGFSKLNQLKSGIGGLESKENKHQICFKSQGYESNPYQRIFFLISPQLPSRRGQDTYWYCRVFAIQVVLLGRPKVIRCRSVVESARSVVLSVAIGDWTGHFKPIKKQLFIQWFEPFQYFFSLILREY
jgi:hypothetical protein